MKMEPAFEAIREAIAAHPDNAALQGQGYQPLFTAGPAARIVLVGQAPGIRAQQGGIPWKDASGQRLQQWMGVDEATFYDVERVAQIPMDFYYPGKGKGGDLPPRKGFAQLWHPRLLHLMPKVRLTLLVGQYAQRYYLGRAARGNLTETVRGYRDYLPAFFPIVHPSALNFRWLNNNPWFEAEVVPELQQTIADILKEAPSK